MRKQLSWTLTLLFILNTLTALYGQTAGTIEGHVEDASGARILGAHLALEEITTGLLREAVTDESGYYRILRLKLGTCQIRVSATGFRDQIRKNVTPTTDRSTRVDFVLRVGEPREVVEVVGETSLVSQGVADWGGSVAGKELAALPLNGRDLFELSYMDPGASIPTVSDKGLTSGQGTQISVFGSRPNMNAFQLDGVFINDATASVPSSAAGLLLGLEAIEEVRIVSTPFSAEHGRTAGAFLTAVSKSGTNEYHGSLYYFLRNSALDAKNFFDVAEEKIPELRRNQFGGSVGGPISSNKLFFFANYEGLRDRRGQTVRPAVPTEEARKGFLPGPAGEIVEVEVSPKVVPYLDLYPLPNGKDFGDGTAEYINESRLTTREDHFSGKLDLSVSPSLQIAGRYTFDDANSAGPDPLHIWTFAQESRYHFLHGQAQWIHSANTIATFAGGFSSARNDETSVTRDDIDPNLSFVPGQPLGSIQVTGLADLGGIRARLRPRSFDRRNFQVGTDWIHAAGIHTLKAGVAFDRIHFNQIADLSAVGHYRFSSLEDYLVAEAGVGEVMSKDSDTLRGWRFSQFSFYLQDELRLRANLDLSLGVRYETSSTPTEVNGKIATLPNPFHDTEMTVGGPLFVNPSKDNCAPRVALAWDVNGNGRTIVRAGGGIFFDLLGTRELVVAGVRVPSFFRRLFVFRPDFPDILGAVEDLDTADALDGLDYYLNQPYMSRWQLSLDRQLTRSLLLTLGYVGSRGVHLPGQIGNINTTEPMVLEDGGLFFPENGPRVNLVFSNIGIRRTAFSSFYQSFSAGLLKRWGSGLSYRLKYTLGKSIDETSNTIFGDFDNSDLMPTIFDYRQNRGLSDFDIRHVFAANFSYSIPKIFSGVGSAVLDGWDVQGIFQFSSGHPFAPTVGFDRARLRATFGDLGQRPNQAGPGLTLLDFALHKALWSKERSRLTFRAEFFNLLNHPNFNVPSGLGLFNSREQRLGTAGRITETSTTSRQIQFGLRFEF